MCIYYKRHAATNEFITKKCLLDKKFNRKNEILRKNFTTSVYHKICVNIL